MPDKDWIDAPAVVLLISKVPLLASPLDAAIEPLPLKSRVDPLAIDVEPV